MSKSVWSTISGKPLKKDKEKKKSKKAKCVDDDDDNRSITSRSTRFAMDVLSLFDGGSRSKAKDNTTEPRAVTDPNFAGRVILSSGKGVINVQPATPSSGNGPASDAKTEGDVKVDGKKKAGKQEITRSGDNQGDSSPDVIGLKPSALTDSSSPGLLIPSSSGSIMRQDSNAAVVDDLDDDNGSGIGSGIGSGSGSGIGSGSGSGISRGGGRDAAAGLWGAYVAARSMSNADAAVGSHETGEKRAASIGSSSIRPAPSHAQRGVERDAGFRSKKVLEVSAALSSPFPMPHPSTPSFTGTRDKKPSNLTREQIARILIQQAVAGKNNSSSNKEKKQKGVTCKTTIVRTAAGVRQRKRAETRIKRPFGPFETAPERRPSAQIHKRFINHIPADLTRLSGARAYTAQPHSFSNDAGEDGSQQSQRSAVKLFPSPLLQLAEKLRQRHYLHAGRIHFDGVDPSAAKGEPQSRVLNSDEWDDDYDTGYFFLTLSEEEFQVFEEVRLLPCDIHYAHAVTPSMRMPFSI